MSVDSGELICSRIRFFEWRLTGKYVYHAYQVYRGGTLGTHGTCTFQSMPVMFFFGYTLKSRILKPNYCENSMLSHPISKRQHPTVIC